MVSNGVRTSGEFYKAGVTVPFVTCFHNDPAIICAEWTADEKRGVEAGAGVQQLTPAFAKAISNYCSAKNVIYIPNAVGQCAAPAELTKEKKHFKIVDVARLSKRQKRQELLVKAFALLAADFTDWTVELWGSDESGYKKELEHLIRSLGLTGRVLLKGVTADVGAVYAGADIFAFPSAYEGFGLTVVEAMTAGLPVAAFRSCSAVNEIVEDGRSGFLSEDGAEAYADCLRKLMEDTSLRARMGRNAHEAAKAYAPETVWDTWEAFLHSICRNG